MNALTTLVILCLAAVSYALPSSRIVGGHDAPAGKYPHMVSLRRNGIHICGGSIINRRYILTAAHCLVGMKPKDIAVHAGTYFTNETGHIFTPQKLMYHPKYDSVTFDNDIGMIRLNEMMIFEYKQMYPITLTDSGQKYEEGDPVFLSGWGRLAVNGKYPNRLQEIELKLIDIETCQSFHPNVKTNHVCTLTEAGQGACYADSGSALIDRKGLQIGIVSYGNPCAVGRPDVYTRILSHKDWIYSQLEYP